MWACIVAGVWLQSSDLTPRDKIVEISEEYHDREDDAEGDAIYDLQSIVIHKGEHFLH